MNEESLNSTNEGAVREDGAPSPAASFHPYTPPVLAEHVYEDGMRCVSVTRSPRGWIAPEAKPVPVTFNVYTATMDDYMRRRAAGEVPLAF